MLPKKEGFMTLDEMLDCIEDSGKENVWLLVEAEQNPLSRIQLRNVFFEALKELQESFDMPNDQWREE